MRQMIVHLLLQLIAGEEYIHHLLPCHETHSHAEDRFTPLGHFQLVTSFIQQQIPQRHSIDLGHTNRFAGTVIAGQVILVVTGFGQAIGMDIRGRPDDINHLLAAEDQQQFLAADHGLPNRFIMAAGQQAAEC